MTAIEKYFYEEKSNVPLESQYTSSLILINLARCTYEIVVSEFKEETPNRRKRTKKPTVE